MSHPQQNWLSSNGYNNTGNGNGGNQVNWAELAQQWIAMKETPPQKPSFTANTPPQRQPVMAAPEPKSWLSDQFGAPAGSRDDRFDQHTPVSNPPMAPSLFQHMPHSDRDVDYPPHRNEWEPAHGGGQQGREWSPVIGFPPPHIPHNYETQQARTLPPGIVNIEPVAPGFAHVDYHHGRADYESISTSDVPPSRNVVDKKIRRPLLRKPLLDSDEPIQSHYSPPTRPSPIPHHPQMDFSSYDYEYEHGNEYEENIIPRMHGTGGNATPLFAGFSGTDYQEMMGSAAAAGISVTEDYSSMLESNKRKLPTWIREALEKREHENQKNKEKEARERLLLLEREERTRREAEASKADPLRSRFDSDSDADNDENESVGKRSRSRSNSPAVLQKRQKVQRWDSATSEDDRRAEAVSLLRKLMTELLLEVTDEEIEKVVSQFVHEYQTRAAKPPQMLAQSSALAAISSLGGGYDSDSGDEVTVDEDEQGKGNNLGSQIERNSKLTERKADFSDTSTKYNSATLGQLSNNSKVIGSPGGQQQHASSPPLAYKMTNRDRSAGEKPKMTSDHHGHDSPNAVQPKQKRKSKSPTRSAKKSRKRSRSRDRHSSRSKDDKSSARRYRSRSKSRDRRRKRRDSRSKS